MYISKIKVDNTEIAIKQIYEKVGISLERFKELLERDFYVPTLGSAPTSETVSYLNTAGETAPFRIGQMCRVANSSSDVGYDFYVLHALADGVAAWDVVDGYAIRLLDEVEEELSRVKEMIWSMSAETYSVGFARENGSADPDAEFTFGTDEMYDKITSHIRMGVVKNGIVQKTCKRGYLTVAEDGSEIAIDGSMGDVMLFTDCKFYKFCETMMIGGREMNVIAIGLSPFSYYDRKAKEIDCFALTPDGTVNCKIFDDIRSQLHCVYNTEVIGTYQTPTNIFKESYKKSGAGYTSQWLSCVNSIKFAQYKNKEQYDNYPYISGYYEFFEIVISLILARISSTNHTNLTDFGVGCTMSNIVNPTTFNDDDISGNSGIKIIYNDGSNGYYGLMSKPFKPNSDESAVTTLSAIDNYQFALCSSLEAQRLLNGIQKAMLTNYIGSNNHIFMMDDDGTVSVITDGSVNINDGTSMIATRHYYIVRDIPKFKGLSNGYMTAVVNSYTKLEFLDGVVDANNVDLTSCTGILKRSIPIFLGWALPIHGYMIQSDGAFYIFKKSLDGTDSFDFRYASNVDIIPSRSSFNDLVDIDSEADIEKGLDKIITLEFGDITGWAKKSNYSSSLFCHTIMGGGSNSYESAYKSIGAHYPSAGQRLVMSSLLGCIADWTFPSIRNIIARYRVSYGNTPFFSGSFSVPHLQFKKSIN